MREGRDQSDSLSERYFYGCRTLGIGDIWLANSVAAPDSTHSSYATAPTTITTTICKILINNYKTWRHSEQFRQNFVIQIRKIIQIETIKRWRTGVRWIGVEVKGKDKLMECYDMTFFGVQKRPANKNVRASNKMQRGIFLRL